MEIPFTRTKKGLTLVEVLLTVSLVAVVSLAIFHALANGLKLWQRSNAFALEEDVAIFFAKLESDLKNSFVYFPWPFEGKETRLTFPTLMILPADKVKTAGQLVYERQMGRVEYFWDAADETIYVRQANYGLAMKDEFFPERPVLTGVSKVRFEYYRPPSGGENADASRALLPYWVKVSLVLKGEPQEQPLERIMILPQGGS